MARRLTFLLLLAIVVGCDGGLLLSVDVRTDFRSGLEFTQVRTEIIQEAEATGGLETSQSALLGTSTSDDFLGGHRVAEFELTAAGTYLLRASLLDPDGTIVMSRDARVTVTESFGITLLLTQSCEGVACPGPGDDPDATSCLGGACVSPDCSPLTPEACGTPECGSDGDCAGAVSCSEGQCLDGYCLQVPVAGSCDDDEWCSVERGCVALPTSDGGVPTCVPEAEVCNGTDDDCDDVVDEGFDLDTDPANCGACGNACGGDHATASCESGACTLACDDGWSDCNGDASDGCEADLTAGASCGSCGNACADPTPLCVLSGSTFSCESSCPPASPTLCGASCVDLDSSLMHCGSCGASCDPPGASAACSSGTCSIGSCDPGLLDCGGGAADGCESALSDPATCGDCGTSCGASSPFCVDPGGGFRCTDGCGDGVRGGDETDVDCGGSLCSGCGAGSLCGTAADCSGTLVCSAGRCASCGECEPGAMDSQACGMCGSQSRSCNASCAWNSWGSCSGEGACMPGAMETEACGNCGTRSRTCNGSCGWGGWSGCSGEGPCAPGAMETVACGNCGTQSRTCNTFCSWDGFSACMGEGPCAAGSTTSAGCPGPCMVMQCNSSCNWDNDCDGCSSSCSSSYAECGSSCSTPGYHVNTRVCSTSCSGSSCAGAPDNRVNCDRSCGNSFATCGFSCPAGYYVASRVCSTSCTSSISCAGAPDNRSNCNLIEGSTFNTCGSSCPSGYTVASNFCSTACTSEISCAGRPNNMVRCNRI